MVLGLTSRDLAVQDCFDTDDGEIGMAERTEWATLRHAALAGAAAECNLLDCLLAYTWVAGHAVDDALPAFAGFLVDLSCAAVLVSDNKLPVAPARTIEGAAQMSDHGSVS